MSNNVLIADDSKNARESWKEVLRATRTSINRIFEAADGEEAVRLFQNERIDFVLLDFDMPLKNGLEVLKDLKRMSAGNTLRVAVISGVMDGKLREDLLANGATVVLEKPFEIYDVVKLITDEVI